jgi:hypothetical protein
LSWNKKEREKRTKISLLEQNSGSKQLERVI